MKKLLPVLLIVLSLTLTGCLKKKAPTTGGLDTGQERNVVAPQGEDDFQQPNLLPTRNPGESVNLRVKLEGNTFSPAEVNIRLQDQVFFHNKDSAAHTVEGEGFTAITLEANKFQNQAFEKAGVYTFYLDGDKDNVLTVSVQ